MFSLKKALIVVALLLLAGCAPQVPPLNFSVPNVGPMDHKIDAEVKSLIVSIGRPDEQLGDIDSGIIETSGFGVGTGNVITDVWKNSLAECLDKTLVFNDFSEEKVSIHVKILKLDMPSMGASFTTKAAALYEITNRRNGDLIFTQVVSSEGTCPAGYAFAGAIRARESVNRAVQNNIALFMQQLETLDISKPMFTTSNNHE